MPKTGFRSTIVSGTVAALAVAGVLGAAPASAVAGGQPVPDTSTAPWMVTLANKGDKPLLERERCGGVLISLDRVLTAAHCLDQTDPTHLEVHIGASVLSTNPGRVVPVKGWSVHPGYRLIPPRNEPDSGMLDDTAAYDAAVIFLAAPVIGVQPVRLAAHSPAPGTLASVYGHGLTQEPDPADPSSFKVGDVLQRGDLQVIDHATCATKASEYVVDGQSMLCADAPAGQPAVKVCSGDSGSPLITDRNGRPELVGITSFEAGGLGTACGVPAGFTDVARIRDWALKLHLPLAPATTQEPQVVGTPTVGMPLSCQPPHWTGGRPDQISFVWDHGKTEDGLVVYNAIDGATAQTFTPTSDLVGQPLLCIVTAHSAGGTVKQYSPASAPVRR